MPDDVIQIPPGFKLFQLEGMEGMNTKAQRPAIEDQQLYWAQNFQLIGHANARTLWGAQSPIYAPPDGLTVEYKFFYNIGAVAYGAAFLSDGSADQFQLSNGAVINIAGAGTFFSAGHIPHAVQWADKGILIVNDAGADNYWAWDGTLHSPGDPAPTWLSGLDAPLSFTGDTNTSTSITSVSPDPTVSGVVIGMGITDVDGDVPVHTTIDAQTTNTFTISNAATGSSSADTFTVDWMMPFGVAGTAIEIFLSRVWIVNGTTRLTSVASNGADFSTGNGGVSAPNTDSSLRVRYTGLKAANGYLYMFGDSECAYVTNVQTTSTPTTTYQYTVIDPQIGTPWRDSIIPYGRSILFANTNGIYALYGSSANKISDALDGIWNDTVADFSTVPPSAGVATIYGIKTFCISVRTTSLYTGDVETLVAMFDGKKWFMGSQVPAPILLAPQEVNSELTCYGSDGVSIFELFAVPNATLPKVLVSKLWGGDYGFIARKQAMRFYLEVQPIGDSDASVTMILNNENASQPATLAFTDLTFLNDSGEDLIFINNSSLELTFQSQTLVPPPGSVTFQQSLIFVNASGDVLQFVNNSGDDLFFQSTTSIAYNNVDGSGLLLGFTMTTQSKDLVVLRGALGYFNKTLLF